MGVKIDRKNLHCFVTFLFLVSTDNPRMIPIVFKYECQNLRCLNYTLYISWYTAHNNLNRYSKALIIKFVEFISESMFYCIFKNHKYRHDLV